MKRLCDMYIAVTRAQQSERSSVQVGFVSARGLPPALLLQAQSLKLRNSAFTFNHLMLCVLVNFCQAFETLQASLSSSHTAPSGFRIYIVAVLQK